MEFAQLEETTLSFRVLHPRFPIAKGLEFKVLLPISLCLHLCGVAAFHLPRRLCCERDQGKESERFSDPLIPQCRSMGGSSWSKVKIVLLLFV